MTMTKLAVNNGIDVVVDCAYRSITEQKMATAEMDAAKRSFAQSLRVLRGRIESPTVDVEIDARVQALVVTGIARRVIVFA